MQAENLRNYLFKKTILAAIGLLLILILILALKNKPMDQKDKNFISDLDGKIVFTKRGKDDILKMYSISVNGENQKLIYQHSNETNSNIITPKWSIDGSKIFFQAMGNDGNWKIFSINEDGSHLEEIKEAKNFLDEDIPDLVFENNSDGLSVESGSVIYSNENGEKNTIYKFRQADHKLNPGASHVQWGPNKEYVVFQSCRLFGGCGIFVADKAGQHVVEIADGIKPHLKY